MPGNGDERMNNMEHLSCRVLWLSPQISYDTTHYAYVVAFLGLHRIIIRSSRSLAKKMM